MNAMEKGQAKRGETEWRGRWWRKASEAVI